MSGDGKRGVAEWLKLPRPSSTLPTGTSNLVGACLYRCAGSGTRRRPDSQEAILGCQAKVALACVLISLGGRDYAQTLNRRCEARWRLASRTRSWMRSRSFFASQRRYFVVADRGRLGATPRVSPLGHGPELSPPLPRALGGG